MFASTANHVTGRTYVEWRGSEIESSRENAVDIRNASGGNGGSVELNHLDRRRRSQKKIAKNRINLVRICSRNFILFLLETSQSFATK